MPRRRSAPTYRLDSDERFAFGDDGPLQLLAAFLPKFSPPWAYNATVNEEAAVTVAGRRYRDDLLRYWPGTPVTVRLSRHDPHFASIYLDNEILCQASQAA
jgi:hypothetical protein